MDRNNVIFVNFNLKNKFTFSVEDSCVFVKILNIGIDFAHKPMIVTVGTAFIQIQIILPKQQIVKHKTRNTTNCIIAKRVDGTKYELSVKKIKIITRMKKQQHPIQ